MRLWQNYRILTAARPGKALQNYRILDVAKLAKFAGMIVNIRENIRKRDYFSQSNRCFFGIRKFCKVYGNFVKYTEVLSSIHKFCHCWIVWLSNCGFFRTDKFVTDALGNPPFRQKTAIFVDKTASVCYTCVMRKRLDSDSGSADAGTAAPADALSDKIMVPWAASPLGKAVKGGADASLPESCDKVTVP